jgi:nitrile hydratase subunit beta
MADRARKKGDSLPGIVKAEGEEPLFHEGECVLIAKRSPIGHYRVPTYIRGKRGCIEAVIRPPAINNETEGFGRNAGEKRHYYRIAIPMSELWLNYKGSASDGLRIEVFETWLERILK